MLREKLYFLTIAIIRGNKKVKNFNINKKGDFFRTNGVLGKGLNDLIPFEITRRTKAIILGFLLPFFGCFVFIYPWCKSLTNKYNRYLDITYLSITLSLCFYVIAFIIIR